MLINYYDENHKRIIKWEPTYLTVQGNKRKAEAMLQARLTELNSRKLPISTVTFSAYLSRWIKDVEVEVRKNTYRTYRGYVSNQIIPYFEKYGILLQELNTLDLEQFYKKKYAEGLSATTVQHLHQIISRALNDAIRAGYITVNPAALARKPKGETFKPKFLNPAQILVLLELFKGSKIELPIQLCVIYGLRRSEVCGLKWSHVDFVNRQFTIAETLQQNTGGSYTDAPKTDSSYRTMPMTDEVYKLLNKQRETQRYYKSLLHNCYKDSDYVCTLTDGTIIQPNYLSKNFHKTISESSLPDIRLHDLRHSVVSNLLAKGIPVLQVSDWVGHGSPSTTMKYYAHVDKASKMGIANALEGALGIENKSDC